MNRCEEPRKRHDWRQQGEAWGVGAGVVVTERCRACGLVRQLQTGLEYPAGSGRLRATPVVSYPERD